MTALEPARRRTVRIPVGLLLSIGAEKPERGPGRAIDHFRAKDGDLAQFTTEAGKFREVYGDEPKELTDLYFLFDSVPAVLDIRLLAFSQSGIRGVGGTNFAEIMDDSEFEARVWGEHAFTDTFTFFPKDLSDIRPEMRESWEGEPIEGELHGLSDPATRKRVEKLEIKVVTSLEFCLPEIMGLGKVARISTSGRASTRNLWKALWTEYEAFGYRLQGIPFRLALRPRKTQRFEAKEKKYVATTVYELVIDTTHTVRELQAALEEHRKVFGLPSRERLAVEGRAMRQALALPMAGEEERTRDEPVAEIPDALLNRIAHLEQEIGDEARHLMLLGAFGVEEASELSAEQADRYVAMLERALPAEDVEGEVVDEDSAEGPAEEPAAHAADPSPEDSLGGSVASEKRDESPSADESSGADSLPSPEDGPAPEPLPGEPVLGRMEAWEVAADLPIPIGGNRGTRLGDVHDGYVKWALQNAHTFADHQTFYAGLELYAQKRLPEVWAEVRA